MCLVLGPKVTQRREHRVGGRLAQSAQRGHLDRPGQPLQPLDILRLPLAVADAGQDIQHHLGSPAAGQTLATRLLLDKIHEIARQVHHTRGFVGDHQPAGAHNRSQVGQRVVINRRVQVLGGDAAPGRSADLDGLEGFGAGYAAAHVKDQLA